MANLLSGEADIQVDPTLEVRTDLPIRLSILH